MLTVFVLCFSYRAIKTYILLCYSSEFEQSMD